MRKGFRNGNWRRLSGVDRAMFRAAVWYARVRGRIINVRVVAQLLSVVKRLKASVGTRILEAGRGMAEEMLNQYERRGVFRWLPRLKAWLRDPAYVFWLGSVRISLQGFYPMMREG